ncbi:hypothetical protein I1A62_01815 (plasmid) [Rhodococcus sp. USK10]|uniref:hypothetical protein n=1 Tax=Rhodococcus sp. USK10 TaxID=2789739 RepID=UPI001C5DC892|nr:hypothetical protein [Rhodococcus sp. USK10]QYA99912.1 hypothetical protein I1A62_01815 [Rhodococcus sp. USK10]
MELLQAQGEDGPCLDAVAAGPPVEVPDLSAPESHRRWPDFTDVTTTLAYRAVLAIPMLLDGHPSEESTCSTPPSASSPTTTGDWPRYLRPRP